MTSDVFSFSIKSRRVVYKHKFDYFFDKYYKTSYPEVIKAIQDSKYGAGIVYISDDGHTLIENFVDGIMVLPGTLNVEDQTKFLHTVARDLAKFLSQIQTAFDPEFPRNKYADILHNGALELYEKYLADDTLLSKLPKSSQCCIKEVVEFLKSDEIQNLLSRFNPQERPFTVCHNDFHFNNCLYQQENDKIIIVDFESAGSNCIFYDLTTLLVFYQNIYDLELNHFRFKKVPEYTDEYLREIFNIFLDNLTLTHFKVPEEEDKRDQLFGIFMETFLLSCMVSIIFSPLVIISGKFPMMDWDTYWKAGKEMYDYWKGRFENLTQSN